MIQAVDLQSAPRFLRVRPEDWKPHPPPKLSPAAREVLSMVRRVMVQGWNRFDPQAGKREAIPFRPELLSRHGARRSARTYRRALGELIGAGLIQVVGRQGRGRVRMIKPTPKLSTFKDPMSTVCPPSDSSNKHTNSHLGPHRGGTDLRLVRTEAAEQPSVMDEPSKDQEIPKETHPKRKRPLRFKPQEPERQRREFSQLVHKLHRNRLTPKDNPYAQANALLRNHRLSFLLPIYREATSPTSGVANPGAWIRVVTNRKQIAKAR